MNSEATAGSTATPTVPTTAPSTDGSSNVADVHSSHFHIKPLQINDQCHVQWRGTNPSTSKGSIIKKEDNDSNETSSKKGASSLSTINLPAIVVERRMARKRKTFRKDNTVVGTGGTNNNSNNNSPGKRPRTGLPHGSFRHSGDTDASSLWVDGTTTTTIKKEMHDTLPADALEYYVHYVDHDRYVSIYIMHQK